MAFVAFNGNGAEAAQVDVTVDVGSSADRKAVVFYVTENPTTNASTVTAARAPSGANEAMSWVSGASGVRQGGGVYLYYGFFYLDLGANTGSQVFRVVGGTGAGRILAVVTVWDGLDAGAPDAQNGNSAVTVTSMSTSVTTLAANSVVFAGIATRTTPDNHFAWQNSETERADGSLFNIIGMSAADIVRATAGAQTVGANLSASTAVAGIGAIAFAPAAAGSAFIAAWALGSNVVIK